ncbi:MAG: hypothetical protein SWX82_35140 [Cyanobacteriota bacterium]|nr:hypothetical protein [Cyanobacteriota bacterium]
MDEAVRKIAGVGLPGVILLIAIATTGFSGAAAITVALAMLGPGGDWWYCIFGNNKTCIRCTNKVWIRSFVERSLSTEKIRW